MTKIIFMGTPAFSVPILDELVRAVTIFKQWLHSQIDQWAVKKR